MSRSLVLGGLVAVTVSVATPLIAQTRRPPTPRTPAAAPVSVVEAGIPELRSALEQGRTTSRALVQQYLFRIATYEDRLNAIVTVNPNALAIADSLDRLRARGVILGPLHGLAGARIGIPRAFFYDRMTDPNPRGGLNDAQRKVMDSAIVVLKAKGAVIVDPADTPR